jgi:hypothetical protein
MKRSSLFAALLVAAAAGTSSAQESNFRDLVRKYAKSQDAAAANQIAAKIGVEKVDGVVALEYKVLHKVGNEEKTVDPNTHKFNLGDKIRVRIEPLNEMYIYIFHEGASGERICLLPTEEEKAPLAKGNKELDLPSDGYFEFAAPPGDEKLIVVATEKPIPDLAGLSNVVFKKPGAALTPEEIKIKEKLKASGQKVLQNIKSRNDQTAYRGILSDEALKKLGEGKTRGVTLEEPPHDKTQSSFAVATSSNGDRPQLLINIPLKSIGANKK